MIEVFVHSLGMEQDTDQPVIILRPADGDRILPIWIGEAEAKAIFLSFQEVPPPRPMTHDLLHNTIRALGFMVERVEITELRETTFYANIVLFDGTNTVEIDARPSDSIAQMRTRRSGSSSALRSRGSASGPSPPRAVAAFSRT